jgi:hypothetical protein
VVVFLRKRDTVNPSKILLSDTVIIASKTVKHNIMCFLLRSSTLYCV